MKSSASPATGDSSEPVRPTLSDMRNFLEQMHEYGHGLDEWHLTREAMERVLKLAIKAEETTRSEIARPCTCHPDDNPPVPCPKKYALTECREAALSATRPRWIPIAQKPADDKFDGYYIGRDSLSGRPVGMTFTYPVDPDFYSRHMFDAVLLVLAGEPK